MGWWRDKCISFRLWTWMVIWWTLWMLNTAWSSALPAVKLCQTRTSRLINILGSFVCKSYLSLCLYICVIVFVSLHLRIFVFVYLPLNWSVSQGLIHATLSASTVLSFPNCYGVRTYTKDIISMSLHIFPYVSHLLMNEFPQIFSSFLDAIALGLSHGYGVRTFRILPVRQSTRRS